MRSLPLPRLPPDDASHRRQSGLSPQAGRGEERGTTVDIDEPSPIRLPWRHAKIPPGRNTMSFVLAIDQGTTSSRAIVFRGDISIAATAQQEFPQHFPASGWVEHEPEDIWTSTIATCREALKKAGATAKDIAAIGITNQRETTVVWDRAT